jgi:hypothetical protein
MDAETTSKDDIVKLGKIVLANMCIAQALMGTKNRISKGNWKNGLWELFIGFRNVMFMFLGFRNKSCIAWCNGACSHIRECFKCIWQGGTWSKQANPYRSHGSEKKWTVNNTRRST